MESDAILMRSNAIFEANLVGKILVAQESSARTPRCIANRRISVSALAAPTMLSLVDGLRPELHALDRSSSLGARCSEFRQV